MFFVIREEGLELLREKGLSHEDALVLWILDKTKQSLHNATAKRLFQRERVKLGTAELICDALKEPLASVFEGESKREFHGNALKRAEASLRALASEGSDSESSSFAEHVMGCVDVATTSATSVLRNHKSKGSIFIAKRAFLKMQDALKQIAKDDAKQKDAIGFRRDILGAIFTRETDFVALICGDKPWERGTLSSYFEQNEILLREWHRRDVDQVVKRSEEISPGLFSERHVEVLGEALGRTRLERIFVEPNVGFGPHALSALRQHISMRRYGGLALVLPRARRSELETEGYPGMLEEIDNQGLGMMLARKRNGGGLIVRHWVEQGELSVTTEKSKLLMAQYMRLFERVRELCVEISCENDLHLFAQGKENESDSAQ